MGKLPYFNPSICPNNTVRSIDMIRVRFFVKDAEKVYDELIRLDRHWQTDVFDNTSIRQSPVPGSYKYFSKIPTYATDAALFIGLYDGALHLQNVVELEYNPNKCLLRESPLTWLLDYLGATSIKRPDVRRYDLAIDFYGVPRNCVFSKVQDARYCRVDGKGESRTQYFGKHQNNGFIKVYNKKVEAGLDEECTRVELTLVPEKITPDDLPRLYGIHYALYPSATSNDAAYRCWMNLAAVDMVAANEFLGTLDKRTQKKWVEAMEKDARPLEFPKMDEDGISFFVWLAQALVAAYRFAGEHLTKGG